MGPFDGAEVIYSYSRAQAIADGVLVDVTDTAREAGFIWPVALTAGAWHAYVEVPEGVVAQDEAGRLWDVVWMAKAAIAMARAPGDRKPFQLHVRNDNRGGTPQLVTLHAVAGRKPSKWGVEYERFDDVDKALTRAREVTRPDAEPFT